MNARGAMQGGPDNGKYAPETSGGVGTGAGGVTDPAQTEATARVNRSEGCPEDPAQAHPSAADEDRLIIFTNQSLSRGKAAAAAVHAALAHYGIEHGAVIILNGTVTAIERRCDPIIHDAGRTEVEAGTVTAGVCTDSTPPTSTSLQLKPTRWWRVITGEGRLWHETDDWEEACRAVRPGDTLQRRWASDLITSEWRDS